ncbi:MAG: chemotaxis protein CheW [Sedimenticola sp.]|nr:chemotaxis protein CheW [Sedimenticola sp.]
MTQENRAVNHEVDREKEYEYLIFNLDGEEYGIDLSCVAEIRCWEVVTRLPNQASYIRGVLNLRGTIIPVLDLRERLQMHCCDYTPETIVLVVQIYDDLGERKVGAVVDAVPDVVETGVEVSASTPGYDIDTELLHGLISVDGRIIRLLDMDKLLPGRLVEGD